MAQAPDSSVGRALGFGVAAVAFAVYGVCTAPMPYLLDSAELADAAFSLGIAHPPGEPLGALWGKLWTLLPIGNVAFRVGLGQAAAGAMAAALLFVLILRLARRLATAPGVAATDAPGHLPPLAVATAAALVFAFAPGSILSADRPEVYALQALLSLAALATAFHAGQTQDARAALASALLIGLGLAQHPLVAGLTGAGAALAAFPVVRRLRLRLVVLSIAALTTGALVIAYLPARAAAQPTLAWGDASSLPGLWWVLSARTFANKASIVHGAASPGDAPFVFMDEIGPAAVLLAVLGAWVLVRRTDTRLRGVALLLTAVGSLVAALIGGLDPQNPDIRGYLVVATATTALLAAAALLFVLGQLPRRSVQVVVIAIAVAGVAFAFPRGISAASRRRSVAAAAFGRELLAGVPPGGALLTANFQSAFLAGYAHGVDGWRTDVAHAHLGFLRSPGYRDRITSAEPTLTPLLGALVGRDEGALRRLAELDRERPVRFEPDPHLPKDIRVLLRPAGLGWRLGGAAAYHDPPSLLDLDAALEIEHTDRQARGLAAWRLFGDAALACDAGLSDFAAGRLARLDILAPGDDLGRALAQRCGIAPRP